MISLAFLPQLSRQNSLLCLPLAALALITFGCSQKEPEIVPEVSVQVSPARTGDI